MPGARHSAQTCRAHRQRGSSPFGRPPWNHGILPDPSGNDPPYQYGNGKRMTAPTNRIGQVADDVLVSLFGRTKVVIGVVHLMPLPGSPRYDGETVEAIYQRGLDDAKAYLHGGC